MEKLFFQRFEKEGSLAYLIGFRENKKAVIIDPVHSAEEYLKVLRAENLELAYIIDTHSHADHVSTAEELKSITKAVLVMHRNVIQQRTVSKGKGKEFGIEDILERNGEIEIDIYVDNGQSLDLGEVAIDFIHTPGHTSDCMSIIIAGRIFTGDTVLIGQCGRTDLPGGSIQDMYNTIKNKILLLSDDLILYPGHDYRGNVNSTIGYEKVNNPFLAERTEQEFREFAGKFFPPLKAEAGGVLHCGIKGPQEQELADQDAKLSPTMSKICVAMETYLTNFPSHWNIIDAQDLKDKLDLRENLFILDVREPDELVSGYIPGAVNISLQQLPKRVKEITVGKDNPIITVCRSGVRSAYAALFLRAYGFADVKSLEIGMLGWGKKGYPLTFS